jgi:hypothetical protein
MHNFKPIFIAVLCAGSISTKAGIYTSGTGETVFQMAAYANLRHDSFGNSYTNIYGTANLDANLNSVNDDRAVLEFPTYQIPVGSTITSATLTLYVDSGGGTTGNVGTFRLWGYNGDGVASMADYYDQQVLLNTFTESVPPTFGNTSFNVTSFLQNQNSSGSQYSGFLFQAISQNVLVGFGGPGNPFPLPTLDVKYTTVPEPSAAALFLLMAALFKIKRIENPLR